MASPHTGVHSQQAATWCNKDAFPGCNPVGFTWFFTIGVSDPWPLAILASDHCPHHVVHYWIHPAGNVALSSVESVAYEVGRRNTWRLLNSWPSTSTRYERGDYWSTHCPLFHCVFFDSMSCTKRAAQMRNGGKSMLISYHLPLFHHLFLPYILLQLWLKLRYAGDHAPLVLLKNSLWLELDLIPTVGVLRYFSEAIHGSGLFLRSRLAIFNCRLCIPIWRTVIQSMVNLPLFCKHLKFTGHELSRSMNRHRCILSLSKPWISMWSIRSSFNTPNS